MKEKERGKQNISLITYAKKFANVFSHIFDKSLTRV